MTMNWAQEDRIPHHWAPTPPNVNRQPNIIQTWDNAYDVQNQMQNKESC